MLLLYYHIDVAVKVKWSMGTVSVKQL